MVIINILYPDNTPPNVWDNISHQYIGDTITYTDTTYYIEIIGFNSCGESNFIDSVLVKPLDIQSFSLRLLGMIQTLAKF